MDICVLTKIIELKISITFELLHVVANLFWQFRIKGTFNSSFSILKSPIFDHSIFVKITLAILSASNHASRFICHLFFFINDDFASDF